MLIDKLVLSGLSVERLSIVAHDLRLFEQMTGRRSAARAALAGALSGALGVGLPGWLFAVLFTHDGASVLATILYWLLLGAALGALFGIAAHAFSGRRSFTSVTGVRAARYDVLSDARVADEAVRLARMRVPPFPSQAG
jgi:hypothetical protein